MKQYSNETMLKKHKTILKEKGEIYLRIKVHPGCAKSELKEILDDETIKIDIAAPPEKGKANKELVRFLSREFEISANNVNIISGVSTPLKLVKIRK